MREIVYNSLKENFRNKALYITGIIGVVIVSFLMTNGSVKFNGIEITQFEKLLPFAIIMCSFFSSILTVMNSSNTIPREFERKFSELIMVRGIKRGEYLQGLMLSNIVVSVLCSFMMFTSIFFMALFFGRADLIPRLILSMFVLAINYGVIASVVSVISVRVPGFLTSAMGVILFFIGSFHGKFSVFAEVIGGTTGRIYGFMLLFIPNLSGIHEISGKIILGEYIDYLTLLWQIILICFIWTLIGILKNKERS